MTNVEQLVGVAATRLAEDISANTIIAIEQAKKEEYSEDYLHMDVIATIFKKIRKGVYSKIQYQSRIRRLESGSIIPIKELIMEGIHKNYIQKDDRIVCVVDESVGMGYKSLMFILDVDKVFFDISTHKLAENINSDVIEAVINIAQEIGREGREGKKIGTSFVVGDKTEILKYTKQLFINPFTGYSEESRKITDPLIKETIKEFAQLDGAFIIDKDGTIVSTGSHITADVTEVNISSGLGTRHRSVAAITKATSCIGVVVSQSGGRVSVFKEGKIVMKL